MKTIRYGLNFSLLLVGAAIFWLARNADLPAAIINLRVIHFGLMGALHAASLMISVRDRKTVRPISALSFIGLATIWSAATPILSLWGSLVWGPILNNLPAREYNPVLLLLLTGSMIGSSGYWVLVRLFLLRSLGYADWVKTVALCVVGTSLSFAVFYLPPPTNSVVQNSEIFGLIQTMAWWFAFSISLFWSESAHIEMSGTAENARLELRA
jgi:hypothetical protein